MLFASIVLLGLLSIVAPWLSRGLGRATGPILALAPGGLFIFYFMTELGSVAAGETIREVIPWIPELGVMLSFRLDGLSLLFAALITGIGSLIVLYAGEYMRQDANRHKFFAYFLGFMTAMLGLVLTDNLILLFIFWELTSITSYLLIGYYNEEEKARKSALQALVVTGLGGLTLLAGLILLGIAAGDVAGVRGGLWEISEIMAVPGLAAALPEHPLFWGMLACLLVGAFTKSAQFPFHFWLPNAMTGPTPVSAFLHSSTMVKAGVYLVLRLNPAFEAASGGHPAWSWLLAGFGGVTMLVGAVLACRETQFKKVLAYSTVSSLGIMVLFTGVGGTAGATAALAYLFAHALFKAALFLVAGTVTHETHEKDVEKLGGLSKAMPITAACGLLAAASLAGAPPLFGFIGKETLLKGAMQPDAGTPLAGLWPVVLVAVIAAAVLTVFAAMLVGWRPFYSPADDEPARARARHAHEPGLAMLAGPAVLMALTVAIPLVPKAFAEPMVQAGVESVRRVPAAMLDTSPVISSAPAPAEAGGGAPVTPVSLALDGEPSGASKPKPVNLSLWYPFTVFPAGYIGMAMSGLAIAGGIFMFTSRYAWRPGATAGLGGLTPTGAEAQYGRIFDGIMAFARWQTRTLQNGHLRQYVLVTLLTTIGLFLVAQTRAGFGGLEGAVSFDGVQLLSVFVLLMMVGATIAATRYRSRLAAIAALGVVGYGVAITFVLLGVPDIAMTQFAIETLTVIIFVLVLYHLPRFNVYSPRWRRALDAAVGLAFGGAMTTLVLVSAGGGRDFAPISVAHGERAYTEAFGKNVVNVILVDFRGIDTLMEIVVLGLAAIGVLTLLKLRGGGGPGMPDGREGVPPRPMLVGGERYGGDPAGGPPGGRRIGSPTLADPDAKGGSA